MNVDLHTHTYPASTCSHISYRDYIRWCREHAVEAVALTNHGDVDDNRKLQSALAAEGVLLVHGVEISTLFGDFIILSPDLDYLERFRDVQDALRPGEVPDEAAVVWVHPGAGGGRSGSAYYTGLERQVAETIDAVEVYNGSWLGARYVDVAERIAAELGVARTGGSDAHELEDLMRCYTEVPDPVTSTADVVAALKGRSTIPRRPEPQRKRRFGIFRGGAQ